MKLRSMARFALVSVLACLLSPPAWAIANFDLYDFSILAVTPTSFQSFGDNVSINRQGSVAFVGTNAGVEQAYRVTLGAAPDALTNVPTAVYGRAVQINDGNLVLTRDRLGAGAPPPTRIRFWQFTGAFTQIAVGGSGQPYDSVLSHPTINNNGSVVYTALIGGNKVMSNGSVDVAISAPSARPMLADTGQVILNDNGQLRLYPPGLAGAATLAGVGAGFTEIGNAPGISDDGSIVAFSGNQGSGRGIFVSLAIGASRQTVPIVGGGAPANPTRLNLPNLGFAEDGSPLFFADIDLANRVGVAHYPGGAAGLEGDSFVLAFLGTPNAGSDPATRGKYLSGIFFTPTRGLFTVRVDIVSTNPLKVRTHVAIPVIQVGSQLSISGSPITIADLQLHDPIAAADTDDGGAPLSNPIGSHRLAFWASDGSKQYIFRARHLNSCLLPVVRLGQATPPWGNDHYAGHPQVTLQEKGCALSAITEAANRAAVDYQIDNEVNPGQLNTQLIAGRGYVGRNVSAPPGPLRAKAVSWTKTVVVLRKPGRLFSAAANSLRFEPFKRSTLKPAQAQQARDYVRNSLCDPVAPAPVIVGTDFVADSDGNMVPHHFVVISGVVNNRFIIADVGYHDVTTMNDADGDYQNQFTTRGRIVDPADLSSMTVAADDDVDIMVTDALGRRTGFDRATNTEFEEIPDSVYFDDALRDIATGEPAATSTRSIILPRPQAGNLTVTVRGRRAGPFSVTMSGIDTDGNDHPDIDISDDIAVEASKTYQIGYTGSPGGTTQLLTTTVPNLVGIAQADALQRLADAGLVGGNVTSQASNTVPAGSVVSQSLAAGSIAPANTAVAFVVSTGSGSVNVPNVIGQTQAAATTAITNAGLVVGNVTQQSSPSVPAGNVISQNPAAGSPVAAGSAVDLVISTGANAVATLDVDASITGTRYDALTDGLLVLRYLSGSTGSALTTGALGSTAARTDPIAIKARLDDIRLALDIDGNGSADALTDGSLIMRYLFGLRGAALIAGAFDPLGARNTAAAIEAYLQTLLP